MVPQDTVRKRGKTTAETPRSTDKLCQYSSKLLENRPFNNEAQPLCKHTHFGMPPANTKTPNDFFYVHISQFL